MEYFVQFQLNIFAILILVVLYMMMRVKARVKSFSKNLLKMIMAAATVAIIFEPLTWIFDRKLFPGAYELEYSTNFVLFLIGPVLGGLMLSYVDYHLYKNPSRLYKRGFYQHLSFLTLLILLLNIFYPVYFDVDPNVNRYSSAAFKEIHYGVLASQYAGMLFMILRNRQKVASSVLLIFIVFFALPIVGMVVQLFDSQLYFSWTSVVLVILVGYTFLETTTTEQDYLTKLYNRQSYELYLKHLLEMKRSFGILLIDLNDFKQINDEHGHHEGDFVLIEFGKILKGSKPEKFLPARLGGDEFIVIVEGHESLESYLSAVHRTLQEHDHPLLQGLRFSYGYQAYEPGMSMEKLYTSADQKMYTDKRAKRSI